jgi:hypothetical protein
MIESLKLNTDKNSSDKMRPNRMLPPVDTMRRIKPRKIPFATNHATRRTKGGSEVFVVRLPINQCMQMGGG